MLLFDINEEYTCLFFLKAARVYMKSLGNAALSFLIYIFCCFGKQNMRKQNML